MKRVVLTTWGSLGDVHPYAAVALALRAQGVDTLMVSSEAHRTKIAALGLDFAPMRPEPPALDRDPEAFARFMDPKRGTEAILRERIFPAMRASYDDLSAAVRPGDVLLSHPLTYAAPIVAEKRRLPWAAGVLAPSGFLSRFDPPVQAAAPGLARLRPLGAAFHGALHGMLKGVARPWAAAVHELRRAEGLAPQRDPMFHDRFSPALNVALFSKALAAPQPDWPENTRIVGFPFLAEDAALDAGLEAFLAAGPAPLVFTLGSAAVNVAGDFFRESAAAASASGARAVFLVGGDQRNALGALPPGMHAAAYAPFAKLLPRAAAVIHQGGIGTTAQAMAAGKPQLVVPFAHDQPDNGDRAARLGLGLCLPRARYDRRTAAAALAKILGREGFAAKAAAIGQGVRVEAGAEVAARAFIDVFGRSPGA